MDEDTIKLASGIVQSRNVTMISFKELRKVIESYSKVNQKYWMIPENANKYVPILGDVYPLFVYADEDGSLVEPSLEYQAKNISKDNHYDHFKNVDAKGVKLKSPTLVNLHSLASLTFMEDKTVVVEHYCTRCKSKTPFGGDTMGSELKTIQYDESTTIFIRLRRSPVEMLSLTQLMVDRTMQGDMNGKLIAKILKAGDSKRANVMADAVMQCIKEKKSMKDDEGRRGAILQCILTRQALELGENMTQSYKKEFSHRKIAKGIALTIAKGEGITNDQLRLVLLTHPALKNVPNASTWSLQDLITAYEADE
jgi:hypothetical protein